MAPERERLDVDILFVGAGIACLCSAYKLARSVNKHNAEAHANGKPLIKQPSIIIIEKARAIGNHSLSGAIVDPIAFKELFPEIPETELPFISKVNREHVTMLTPKHGIGVPRIAIPKAMQNEGLYIASLGEIVRWLAKKCEEQGIEIYTEFAVTGFIKDGERITGAIIADKKTDALGNPFPGYTPGMDVYAKVTVLGEGSRGYLAQQLIEERGLDKDANPQVWGLGLKELIDVPEGRIGEGTVYHSLGYPLAANMYGGSFLYPMSPTRIALGIVVGLDYRDPMFSSHETLLRFKAHPMIAKLIEGGKVAEYGAKTMTEGGYFSIPKLSVDGAVLVGECAGFIDTLRLKGIHLAAKSGILAAERILSALSINDFSARFLDYRVEFDESWAGRELYKSRNYRQGFHAGLLPGMFLTGVSKFTLGLLPAGRMRLAPDSDSLAELPRGKRRNKKKKQPTDKDLNVDIETDLFLSGTVHDEHQKSHCHILRNEDCVLCREKYFMPCTRFCPAKVYEEELNADGTFKCIHVSFSNCVHCKTCEIKDPFYNIEWVPPQGGDGPRYKGM
jgi:electron-transferring-flavoprotein dehydrogenase